MTTNNDIENDYDVIIVGSGAGAMTAAIFAADQGNSVLIVEKSDKYGGTSAISGGGIWIPNNDEFKALGGTDSEESALTYIKAASAGSAAESRIRTYIKNAPKMLRELQANSRVKYAVAEKYPDYYQHLEGSLPGGRSMDPELFDTTGLGDEIEHQQPASGNTLLMGKMAWTARQAHKAVAKERGWMLMIIGLMLRYKLDFKQRKKGRRDRRAGLGGSLVASLRHSVLDRKIPLWRSTEFTDFVITDDKVTGIKVLRDGQELTLNARYGVIMGSGGFEQNQQLREKYLPHPTQQAWSATPKGCNTGAALEAGQKLGAATDLLDWCWWAPTLKVPKEQSARGLFAERAFPGAIVVDGLGKRFFNEAAPYLEFGDAMYRNHQKTGNSIPSWVVFDSHFRHEYAMGPLMPGKIMPDSRAPKAWRDSVYWKADTLEALSELINVDATGLAATVTKMNGYAKTGIDEEFQRGGNVFDRYYGDTSVKPNPCLAPIEKGPFYAMKIHPGDIGTKGGLLTNDFGQVVRPSGEAITGLYAIGNCSSSVMGTSYPGAGATIGPAMTFGYVAANHISANRAKTAE
ncbi:FAD-binding protein [Cognaticolwellia beringensis]|uniref:3-oxosteroid 1-dehydrogenase n=1 Tax=Cognaticolwellia beringensis TaxID=1967665 RepID=A0A222G8U8_9GAMM|nr:FAD-binding protein [Cognaticolwellia beringensis]ASP48297.1 FAD-binding protein [Cognaticolwellia beringensis]